MPEMNGLEAARAIRRKLRGTEVLVLTRHVSESIARLALRSGARGYVAKSDPHPELITALQSVREKRLYVTTQLARKLQDEFARIETGSSADLRLRPDPRVSSEQIIAALVRAEEKMRDEAMEMVNSRNRHPKLP
jgi:two-component system response regulator NreC